MKKWVAAVFLIVASCAAFISPSTAALTTVSAPFTLIKPTTGPVLQPPAGSNLCQVMLNGPPAFAYLAPQSSNDTYIWRAIPFQTGLDVTQGPGQYYGIVPDLYFRFILSQVNYPGITGYEYCSNQQQAPLMNGENATLSTVVVDDLTDDNLNGCLIGTNGHITAVPLPCSSGLIPSPNVSATATACGAPVVGGTGGIFVPVCPSPYPTPTVSATATACGAPVLGSILTVFVPVCATPSPVTVRVTSTPCANPAPTASGTTLVVCTNQFEPWVLAQADVTHFWEMHDNPVAGAGSPNPCPTGANVIADAIGGGATGNPSPVPLAVVTVSPQGAPICGAAPILKGGVGTSIQFCTNFNVTSGCRTNSGGTHSSYIDIPLATFPAAPYTIGCIFAPTLVNSHTGFVFNMDADSLKLNMGYNGTGVTAAESNGGFFGGAWTSPSGILGILVNDGTKVTSYWNGVGDTSVTPAPSPATNDGRFGDPNGSAGAGFNGRIQDCWFANTAWSDAKIQQAFLMTGF